MDNSVSRGSSFGNVFDAGPPLGFPSDLELTRMANQMFGECGKPSSTPRMVSTFPVAQPSRLDVAVPEAASIAKQGRGPLALPSTSSPFSNSPFAFLEEQGAASFPHPTAIPEIHREMGESGVGNLEDVSRVANPQPTGSTSNADAYSRLTSVGRVIEPISPVKALSGTSFPGFAPTLIASDTPLRKSTGFDANAIRGDFPILGEVVHGKPLVWLDNAATTQKPQVVIDRLSQFYLHENSNIHRAAHELARRSTDAYEAAREAVGRFINASSSNEIVFVRGTTEAINLIAQTFGRQNVGEGDEVIVTHLEHHANIVPWQQLCSEKKARLLVAPVDDRGQIILDEYSNLFSSRTKFVSLSQVSNALGTITPAREMVEIAHRRNVPVLVDGAQSVSHMPVDVQQLDCDFFVFSGHKVYGPTGIGVLYGKEKLLNDLPPWQGGGNMIQDVTFERTIYHAAPMRFEAGTGNIADAVGLNAAIDYVQKIGLEKIGQYENVLLEYATNELTKIPGLRMIGTAAEKAGVLAFVVDGVETEAIGKSLSREGIAVRSGHHCAQPILRRFGLESTVRASLAVYNTLADIDRLVTVVRQSVQ